MPKSAKQIPLLVVDQTLCDITISETLGKDTSVLILGGLHIEMLKLASKFNETEMDFDEWVAVASHKSPTIGFWLLTHKYPQIIVVFIRSHITGRENSDLWSRFCEG